MDVWISSISNLEARRRRKVKEISRTSWKLHCSRQGEGIKGENNPVCQEEHAKQSRQNRYYALSWCTVHFFKGSFNKAMSDCVTTKTA